MNDQPTPEIFQLLASTSPPATTVTNLTVSAPPPSGRFEDTIFDSSEIINSAAPLKGIEMKIKNFINGALRMKCANMWTQQDDDIFLSHTILINTLLNYSGSLPVGLELLPVRIWEDHIFPMVETAEVELRKSNANARIHKGAPFFNVALCLFLSGDFHRAYQYFAEAGKEDELSGRGSRYLLLIGDNKLAERVIIDPLVQTIVLEWATDYAAITGNVLNAGELKSVIAWLVQRAPDAVQTVIALHRFRQSKESLNNEVSRYQLVCSLTDLVLPVESSLRRWQTGVDGQLFHRMDEILKTNPPSCAKFNAFHNDFAQNWPWPQCETGTAVNWVVSQTFSRLKVQASVAERIGVAAYLVVRLRNSLMHVNEETLGIYKDPRLCMRVAGIAFAMLRISKHGNDKTLSSL
jgi:hypothetical protein